MEITHRNDVISFQRFAYMRIWSAVSELALGSTGCFSALPAILSFQRHDAVTQTGTACIVQLPGISAGRPED